MIIVKTGNGDVFINEKNSLVVKHNHKAKQVNVVNDGGAIISYIDDVELVLYTNDAQPTHWEDEGSEVKRLKEAIERLREEITLRSKLTDNFMHSLFKTYGIISFLKLQLGNEEDKRSWSEVESRVKELDDYLEETTKRKEEILTKLEALK